MDKLRLIFLIAVLACLSCFDGYSYTLDHLEIDGIYYSLDDDNMTAFVGSPRSSSTDTHEYYKGNVTIPESIVYKGEEFKVIGIGINALSGQRNLTDVDIFVIC